MDLIQTRNVTFPVVVIVVIVVVIVVAVDHIASLAVFNFV